MVASNTEKLKPLESWEDGLDANQKAALAECVQSVATTTAGTYKQLAAAFAKARDLLPADGRNWIKWTNAIQLNVGARTIQELAGANKWLQSTSVPDETLGKLAARTISMIAQADARKQNELEAQLIKGRILTVTDVKTAIEGTPKPKEVTSPKAIIASLQSDLQVAEAKLVYAKEFIAEQVDAGNRVREERDAALAKIEELQRLVNKLTETPSSAENAGIEASSMMEVLANPPAGMKVETVAKKTTPAISAI